MIELPEAVNIASQITSTIAGKRIASVTAAHTPHKLAWYYGEPAMYSELLVGKSVGEAIPFGGLVEIKVENVNILFGDGAGIRFHSRGEKRPAKHQLLLEFDDDSAMSASIQMYGGLGAFSEGKLDNPYYRVAREKPSPLSEAFDETYFDRIISEDKAQKLSLKALLATNQSIPGLGNGILQDILFNARMHPKKKVNTLCGKDNASLFNSVKTTISMMTTQGGRDIELDLFGKPGGYKTMLNKNTVDKPCPVCGRAIKKESYMGGTVYYCEKCQKS